MTMTMTMTMTTTPAVAGIPYRLAAMTPEAVDMVRRAEARMQGMPQVAIGTGHLIHGGMYARTVRIPAGAVMTGALIKRATVLVVSGRCSVFTGGDTLELHGYHVIPASAGRKQVFIAHADTDLTMIFPSRAGDVAQAEAEFTDEADRLLSRRADSVNYVVITGE